MANDALLSLMAFHEWYRVDYLCAFDTRISGKNEKKHSNIW